MMLLPPGDPSAKHRLAVAHHDGRRHRRARPLAGLDAVGDRGIGRAGIEGEIGQLVVEDEAVDQQPRAERVLDRRGHRGDVAVGIDDDDVRGRRQLQRRHVAPELRLVPGRLAGLDVVLAERGRPADQRAARLQVRRIEQAFGNLYEIAVGDVALAVGEGEAGGIADDAPGLGIVGTERGDVERLDHAEDLSDRQRAGGGRAHAADLEAAIGRADGRPLLDLVAGEVGEAEPAWIGRMAADRGDDVGCDPAAVESVGAACGDRLQRIGIGLVDEQRADGSGAPAASKK